jgi:hypothetical protein
MLVRIGNEVQEVLRSAHPLFARPAETRLAPGLPCASSVERSEPVAERIGASMELRRALG